MTSSDGSFGDAAGEMANETEVEVTPQGDASASAGATGSGTPDSTGTGSGTAPGHAPGEDISGVDNWVEEGGPLEPQDVADVEGGAADPLTAAETALAERTVDLQRLQAEFLNYKRRVDRDRDLIAENATYKVLSPIIEVLDTIDRAREHGEVDGGFKSVADQLERIVAGLGLTKFGAPGDAFDPTVHEALSHIGEDPDVEVTTAKVVAKSGYKIGDRVVRAAQVLVVDPATPTA
ncbi:nucleotide exchange factor GrpE [Nocardioides sp. Soil777]|uniref:nucleotide exchange factor GrpE n=1 Tax=Nocardioides sp. Soil777 TaxID=1736409 RepID=UPI000A437334|nr:nucleotide exchange factor GrpE [Nocardioides sp. Soil777]